MIQVSTEAPCSAGHLPPRWGQVAATPGVHSVADNLPGLTARAAHAPPPCVLQHMPAWKDALIRESTTGNLTPEDKKVGTGERGLWTWCPLRLCVCCQCSAAVQGCFAAGLPRTTSNNRIKQNCAFAHVCCSTCRTSTRTPARWWARTCALTSPSCPSWTSTTTFCSQVHAWWRPIRWPAPGSFSRAVPRVVGWPC